MTKTIILSFAKKIFDHFWNSKEVKEFVVHLLEKYSASTDNKIDDVAVELVRSKIFG